MNSILNNKWQKHELEYLSENYGKLTTVEIANHLNRSKSAIQLKANRKGLKFEDKYFYDKAYFKKIDSQEKAYWLGFIYGDGYVVHSPKTRNFELGIELQKRDKEHLKNFNKSINGNIEVTHREKQGFLKYGYDTSSETCLIRIYSKKMVADLINHGVCQNKTYEKMFPKDIKETLMPHFLRGFFDADGHICLPNKDGYKYRIGFTSNNIDFLNFMREYFYKNNIISHIHKENKSENVHKLEIGNRKSILKCLELIYENSNICLKRKHSKYIKLKKLLSDLETCR